MAAGINYFRLLWNLYRQKRNAGLRFRIGGCKYVKRLPDGGGTDPEHGRCRL